jgi:hypothetical protein
MIFSRTFTQSLLTTMPTTKIKKKRSPYSERSDLEKIKSNWKKTVGLHKRREWSTTVMRAVTTVELSANYVIRKELEEKRNIDAEFVDHLLIWANGIRGKFDKLILPLCKADPHIKQLKDLNKKIQEINQIRNGIAHSGKFSNAKTAKLVLEDSREIIQVLISIYENGFVLKK